MMKMKAIRHWIMGIALMLAAVPLAMLISGSAYADEDVFTPKNGIPLVVIRVDEQELHQNKKGNWYGSINDMNTSEDHSVRCEGTIEIIVPDGFTSEYGGSAPAGQMDLDYIRGRGNSTWNPDPKVKKPYKIKYDDDQDLFGMGENKEWALMANANDQSLIKNHITSWLGIAMGHEESPRMVPVDVVMTDSTEDPEKTDYLGSYCLSELVDLGRVREDLHDPEGADDEGIDTWYLLTIFNDYQNSDEPASTVFKTDRGIELINKDPSYDDTKEGGLTAEEEQQRAYIRKYVQDIEDMILKADQIDQEAHDRIASMLDLEAAADYWLIQEFCVNGDAFGTSSTYFYKERDGKLCMGPLWDFDIAYGFMMKDEEREDIKGINKIDMPWILELRDKDPLFGDLLEQRWEEMKGHLAELTKAGGVIDTYAADLMRSQAEDEKRWPGDDTQWEDEYGQDDSAPPAEEYTYEEYVTGLKRWIDARRGWIDAHKEQLGKVYGEITFIADGEEIGHARAMMGTAPQGNLAPIAPDKKGYIFSHWYEEESEEDLELYVMERDIRAVAAYVREEDAIAPEKMYFSEKEDWQPINPPEALLKSWRIYPEDATNQTVRWAVSDESIVSINDECELDLHKTGTVTITGTLYNGVSASYVLHVYDQNVTPAKEPTAVKPDFSAITLKPGETEQITYSFEPEGEPITDNYAMFESSDESIAEVDEYGVVTAKKAGTAVITVSGPYSDDGRVTAQVTVTVASQMYTITYDLNGGTLDGKTGTITEQYEEGEEITIKDAPTRSGYTFRYWEGSEYHPGDPYTVTEDHTLKALWAQNSADDSDSDSSDAGNSDDSDSSDSDSGVRNTTNTSSSGTNATSRTTGTTARTGTGTTTGTTTAGTTTSAGKSAQSVKTGDTGLETRWIVLMFVSVAVMTGIALSWRRQKV